ncbi:MAG TPA: hypothetical protein VI756_29400, partial [Blastocatellia bacterium]
APVDENASTPDAYVDTMFQSIRRMERQVEENGREPASLGGIDGIRVYTHQMVGIVTLAGYYTVCDDLFNHYVFSGVCADFLRSPALRAYQELMAGFRIIKSVDKVIAERADILSEVIPYLSAESSRQLALYLAKTHTSERHEQIGGLKTIDQFVGLLPSPDQTRFRAFSQQSLGALSSPERARLAADRSDLYNGSLSDDGIEDYGGLASKAFNGLPAAARTQLSALADRAIKTGVSSQSPDN